MMANNRKRFSKADQDDILEKLNKQQIFDPDHQPFEDGHAAEKISEIIGIYERKEI